ncbi:unnamed protein product [Fusarium langsethiae]|nr:unnamed protein product [Fusarium langsethiae]
MATIVGLSGSLGSDLKFDKIERILKDVPIEFVKRDSNTVPQYVVTRHKNSVPESWRGVPVVEPRWLEDMMQIKKWIDPPSSAEPSSPDRSGKRKNAHPINPKQSVGNDDAAQSTAHGEAKARADEADAVSQSEDTDGGSRSQEETGGDSASGNEADGDEKPRVFIKAEEDATNGAGLSTPAKLLAEEEARKALEKAEQEYKEALNKASALGVNTAGLGNHGAIDDPFTFRIPAEWREENVPGSGTIMYNTDKGYLLVYEKFKNFFRAYMISGSQYPMEKKAFIANKGPRLDAQIVTTGARRDEVNIFDIEIEAIAVLWGRNRVHRAFITLREPGSKELLLYNITTMRARWGEANTTLRLYYEFLMREQEPVWFPAKKRRVNRHHNSELKFLRKNSTAINSGKKAVQILKMEDNEDELELVEEELEVVS